MADKAKKIRTVDQLKQSFATAKTVVVAQFSSLTIPETDQLRKIAKKNGSKVQVTKNTLAQVALKDTAHAGISSLFKTQTIIAYSEDPVGSAKTLIDFAKNSEKLSIAGGSFEGKVLDFAGVQTLASLPSLDESRAKIASLLVASATQIARLVASPAGKLARVFSAYGESGD